MEQVEHDLVSQAHPMATTEDGNPDLVTPGAPDWGWRASFPRLLCIAAGVLFLTATGLSLRGILQDRTVRDHVTPRVERFLSAVLAGEDDRARGMIGYRWRDRESREAFVELATAMRDSLGPLQRITVVGVQSNSDGGEGETKPSRFLTVTYAGQFAKGDALLTFNMEKMGGGWVVQGLGMDLPRPPNPTP